MKLYQRSLFIGPNTSIIVKVYPNALVRSRGNKYYNLKKKSTQHVSNFVYVFNSISKRFEF